MLARSIALALLLLLHAPVGWAGEPAGATVVLQLPPSMSPEAVKGLIADLAAKGARPVAQPSAPPESAPQPVFTTANVAAQVWDGSKRGIQALPILRETPHTWIEQVEADGARRAWPCGFGWLLLRVSWLPR